MKKTYISSSEKDTINYAKTLASNAKNGDIIILSGDLGAGKTKFTEGFLTHFNLENDISSPTFTIVNEYRNNNISIFHFDLYRLEDIDEFYAIGGDEYFDKGICIFEWGEILLEELNRPFTKIVIEKDNKDINKRIFHIEYIN